MMRKRSGIKRSLCYGFLVSILVGAGAGCSGDLTGKTGQEYQWIPLESLQLPTLLPENGTYALLAGQFAALESAVSLQKRALSSHIAATTIPVIDRSGAHWFVVALGSFGSPDDARVQRPAIQQSLSILDELPLILLPD